MKFGKEIMRVKICGIKSDNDLQAAINAGADAVGLLVGQLYASTDFILPGTALRFSQMLPPYISPVIVTHLVEADTILDIMEKTGINTVQLHGGSDLKEVKKLRDLLPSAKIIFAIHVKDGEINPSYEDYIPYINAFLLDSYNKNTNQVGGTGKVHDWKKSAEFCASSRLPVIVAGGLNPKNVADAIKTINPYGVDANSGLKDQNRNCSPELCKEFVKNAKQAFFDQKNI